MGTTTTIAALKEQAADEPIQVLRLETLRDAVGVSRLGTNVLVKIKQKLAGQGLGYFPSHVLDHNSSPNQWEEVRIYAKDSTLGRLIEAVNHPSEPGDTYLRELADQDSSAAETLDRIRDLLG